MISNNIQLLPIRLNPGDDLKIKLFQACQLHQIEAGFIISGIGSLKTLQLRLANSNDVLIKNECFEILSLQGSISVDGLHIHLSVSDAKGQVVGGHLMEGCLIFTTAEILVVGCPDYNFTRPLDTLTKFKELKIQKKIRDQKL
ncbi:MAG: PPC domain-containing DNA-binding protein [Bdellovibrionales bacterium]